MHVFKGLLVVFANLGSRAFSAILRCLFLSLRSLVMGMRRCLLIVALLSLTIGSRVDAGSETPPKGAPWTQDFLEAQRTALEGGKPILLYFTKTY